MIRPPVTLDELEAELARRDFGWFLRRLVPGYMQASHQELVCRHLEALEAGATRKLMVLMPPRHGKTLEVARCFPAWVLGRHPSYQIISSSYGAELAEDNSNAIQRLIAAERYPFPTSVDPNSTAAGRWRLREGGGCRAAGIGGGITGFGADLLVLDDLVKDRAEADSEVFRDRTWNWYTDVASTRLSPLACTLLVMTRWHHDDIAGRILASADAPSWTVLRLPALAESDDLLGRKEGEPLWPARYDAAYLNAQKNTLGPRSFAALYQQRPTPEQGTILRREWFNNRYHELPNNRRTLLAVDSAFKTGVGSDYTVIAAWATDDKNFYLVDCWRGQVEFPDLVTKIRDQNTKHRPGEILIEDAASGQSAIQALRRETNLPIIAIPPNGSKESRLDGVSGLFEAGKVLLPDNQPWLGDWIEEHVAFPRGRHDDMVDSTSLALERLRGDTGPRIRTLTAPPGRRAFG